VTYITDTLLAQAQNELIIVQKKNSVHIGPYIVFTKDGVSHLTKCDVKIAKFNSKKAAVAFAVSEFNSTITQSKIIKQYDRTIGKHQDDIRFYRASLQTARNHNNHIKADVLMSRIDYAAYQLASAKYNLMVEIKKVRIT